jgi:hypothetical protein
VPGLPDLEGGLQNALRFQELTFEAAVAVLPVEEVWVTEGPFVPSLPSRGIVP